MGAIKVFHGADLIITSLFLFAVLVYVITIVLVLILPSLTGTPHALKIALFVFSIFGAFALIIKYVLEYDKFIALGFLIFYVLAYVATALYILRKKRRESRLAEKLLQDRQNRLANQKNNDEMNYVNSN